MHGPIQTPPSSSFPLRVVYVLCVSNPTNTTQSYALRSNISMSRACAVEEISTCTWGSVCSPLVSTPQDWKESKAKQSRADSQSWAAPLRVCDAPSSMLPCAVGRYRAVSWFSVPSDEIRDAILLLLLLLQLPLLGCASSERSIRDWIHVHVLHRVT